MQDRSKQISLDNFEKDRIKGEAYCMKVPHPLDRQPFYFLLAAEKEKEFTVIFLGTNRNYDCCYEIKNWGITPFF